MISVRDSCILIEAEYRDALASIEATSAAIEGPELPEFKGCDEQSIYTKKIQKYKREQKRILPGLGWVTSAPIRMVGLSVINGIFVGFRKAFMPPNLTFIFKQTFAQYCLLGCII